MTTGEVIEQRSTWVTRVYDWALHRSTPAYLVVVLAVSIIKNGAGIYPDWPYMQALALHWTNPHASLLFRQHGTDFLLGSPTSAVAAGVLHLTGESAYLAFHFVLACVAITMPFALRRVYRSPQLRLTVALLLIGGAIPSLLLDWVGSYDPVTIGAAAVAALARSRVAVVIAWALLAFNNAPEAALALVVFCPVLLAGRGRAVTRRIALSCGGAALGYMGIRTLGSTWGGASTRFAAFHGYAYSRFVTQLHDYWPLILFSALGVGWLFLASSEVRKFPAARVLLVLSVIAGVGIPLIALDATRIVAGVLWPSLLACAAMIVPRLSADSVRKVLTVVAPVALILPALVVWNDHLVYGGWTFFSYMAHRI